MYAIVTSGGKQYKVEKNATFNVEKLEAENGAKVTLDVLMLVDGDEVLAGDSVKNAKVEAEVIGSGKEKKVVIYKYKAKKNERRRNGHRQPFTTLKVSDIIKG